MNFANHLAMYSKPDSHDFTGTERTLFIWRVDRRLFSKTTLVSGGTKHLGLNIKKTRQRRPNVVEALYIFLTMIFSEVGSQTEKIKLTFEAPTYDQAVETGAFEGIFYKWSKQGDIYTIYLSQEDYRIYKNNKGEHF